MNAADTVVIATPVYITEHTYPAELIYTATDPHAVRLHFLHDSFDDCMWIMERDLLRDGYTTDPANPLGYGDVRISGAGQWTWIQLQSPSGKATVRLDSVLVQVFLGKAFDLVPAGTESEHLDFDTAGLFPDGASWE